MSFFKIYKNLCNILNKHSMIDTIMERRMDMECPKKCGGELRIFEMNGVKYAQCNNCGQIFSADSLQTQMTKTPPPHQKKRKKGSCLQTLLGLVCIFFFLAVIITLFSDPEDNDPTPEENTSENRPLSDFVDDVMPMETLLFQVEAGVSNKKYDGYTLDYDESSITINVWRESITTTVNIMQSDGRGADDDNWIWLKNNTGNTPDYICDCIRCSGRDMTLYFNVLDDQDHDRVLLKFVNTDVVYDILEG